MAGREVRGIGKVIIALLLGAVLALSIIAPAIADKGNMPNEDAWWGQLHKDAPAGAIGHHASGEYEGKKGSPPMGKAGGVRAAHLPLMSHVPATLMKRREP
jgi:hypothetical protein